LATALGCAGSFRAAEDRQAWYQSRDLREKKMKRPASLQIILGALLAFFSSSVFAAYQYQWVHGAQLGSLYSSPDQAADEYAARTANPCYVVIGYSPAGGCMAANTSITAVTVHSCPGYTWAADQTTWCVNFHYSAYGGGDANNIAFATVKRITVADPVCNIPANNFVFALESTSAEETISFCDTATHCNVTGTKGKIGITDPSGVITYTRRYYSDGSACSNPDAKPGDVAVDGGSGQLCVTSQKGNTVCIDPQVPNCGTVNGTSICLDHIPDGACTIIAGGSYVCDNDINANSVPPRPSLPNTPTVPILPEIVIDPPVIGGGTVSKIDFWSPGALQNGTTTDNPGAPTTINIDTSGIISAQNATTNAVNNVKTSVDGLAADVADGVGIDETGTPTGSDNMFDGLLSGTGIDDFISGLSNQPTMADHGIDALDLMPSAGACQSITMTFFNKTISIPSASGCASLQAVKDILAWVVYIATAYTLVMIALGVKNKEVA